MRGIFLLIGILLVFNTIPKLQAAECIPSDFSGKWQNIRAETKVLSMLEIVDTCDPDGPYGDLKVRALEVCHPRHCSWGWTDGVVEGRTLFAAFNTFIAKRRIIAVRSGLKLRVMVETDYITDDREDTKVAHILVRIAD